MATTVAVPAVGPAVKTPPSKLEHTSTWFTRVHVLSSVTVKLMGAMPPVVWNTNPVCPGNSVTAVGHMARVDLAATVLHADHDAR